MRLALAAALSFASGCYADHVRHTCDGDAPDLADCFSGPTFADCGGDPGPQFACIGVFDCRWFTGSCLARDYVASSCPVGQVCCGRDEHPLDGSSFVTRWGARPWDATRAAAIDVRIDSSAPVGDAAIACSAAPEGTVCAPLHGDESFGVAPSRVEDIWRVNLFAGGVYESRTLHLDLLPVGGAIVARACHQEYTDSFLVTIPCSTLHAHEPWCADRGSITLDRNPFAPDAGIPHGRGELWFGDLRIDVAF